MSGGVRCGVVVKFTRNLHSFQDGKEFIEKKTVRASESFPSLKSRERYVTNLKTIFKDVCVISESD